MNKTELVVSIAEKAAISKKDAEKALSAFLDTVVDELKKGGTRARSKNRYQSAHQADH